MRKQVSYFRFGNRQVFQKFNDDRCPFVYFSWLVLWASHQFYVVSATSPFKVWVGEWVLNFYEETKIPARLRPTQFSLGLYDLAFS